MKKVLIVVFFTLLLFWIFYPSKRTFSEEFECGVYNNDEYIVEKTILMKGDFHRKTFGNEFFEGIAVIDGIEYEIKAEKANDKFFEGDRIYNVFISHYVEPVTGIGGVNLKFFLSEDFETILFGTSKELLELYGENSYFRSN